MARRPPAVIAPDIPRLPDDLEPATVDAAKVDGGDEWSRVALVNAALSELAAPGLRFEEARLERVDFSASRLAHISLSDVELESCNLANVDARGGSLWRARLARGRLTGLSWTGGLGREAGVSG